MTWASLHSSTLLAGLVLVAAACQPSSVGDAAAQEGPPVTTSGEPTTRPSPSSAAGHQAALAAPHGLAVAIFAGGCFWCMEGPFEAVDGVSEVLSGYTGGDEPNPTYREVGSGRTGHTEAVRVVYDPTVVGYAALLDVFWRSFDPTDAGGQFADRGPQYRPAIFVTTAEERAAAERSRANLEASGRFDAPIVVPVADAGPFWVAEDYHQDYYRTNPDHSRRYRRGSGREAFLQEHWGDDH